MGAMKSVRTAMTLSIFPSDETERKTYRALVKREERYREERDKQRQRLDETDNIESVYLRHAYVGSRPSKEGQYVVVDTATQAIKMVSVEVASNGCLVVCLPGEQRPTLLVDFNLRSYRWFRIVPFIQDDVRMIRSLPLADVRPAYVG